MAYEVCNTGARTDLGLSTISDTSGPNVPEGEASGTDLGKVPGRSEEGGSIPETTSEKDF